MASQPSPFNGWSREIGSRNFADSDRYDILATVRERLGLPVDDDRSLWKDRAKWSWVVSPDRWVPPSPGKHGR